MHLTIFNGSPKHGDNNTAALMRAFAQGFESVEPNQVSSYQLNQYKTMEEAAKQFNESEMVLLAFPLYSYAMPAGVKAFIEALACRCDSKAEVPRIKLGFVVQYGFREAVHARPLEAYLVQLAEEIQCDYMGTIIKGGCDSLAKMPQNPGNKPILLGAQNMGRTLGKEQQLNAEEVARYALPEKQGKSNRWIMKIMVMLINQFYWKAALKKNGANKNSFDQPYSA